jgi:hypothetical protein
MAEAYLKEKQPTWKNFCTHRTWDAANCFPTVS